MGLTLKQKRFADEYIISGNATNAAIKAGYSRKTAKSSGNENLTKPDIQNYIKSRTAELESAKIADMREIREFWTRLMRNEVAKDQDRLKASELMARTQGAFIERQEVTLGGDMSIAELAERYKKYLTEAKHDSS